jgi:predicted dehydrogenase
MEPPGSSRIRIALLGTDASTAELLQTIAASDRFELVGICEAEPADAEGGTPREGWPVRERRLDVWESLLDPAVVDAVVVARTVDQDRRADQIRKLIQVGMPLLLGHPLFDSMLVYYELDMIRRETACVVLPALPERRHPAIRLLAEMVNRGIESPIGKIEQLVVERSIGAPAKANVLRFFSRDVDVVRAVAGDMTRLGALAGASGALAYTSLGVHMSGPAGIVARWSVVPSLSGEGARLTLLGANGRAVVHVPDGNEPWTAEVSTDGIAEGESYEGWNPIEQSLGDLAAALQGEPCRPDLVDAARSIELTETIDRSLLKGRTIELYFEEYTEEGTFKGTMTSIGCGLLLLSMFLLGAVAIGEQMGLPYVRLWPYLLVGALGIFLLMQLLLLVFGRASGRAVAGSASADEPQTDDRSNRAR